MFASATEPTRSIFQRAAILLEVPPASALHGFLFLLLFAVLSIAAYTDLRSRRIPNLLTLPAAGLAIILHGLLDGWGALGTSTLAYVLSLSLGIVLYSTVLAHQVGAGDLKLLATCAAFLGWMGGLYVAFLSFALHVLWMMIGWFRNGVAGKNFSLLIQWIVLLATPKAARLHFLPAGTPDRSPHAPFVLASFVVWSALTWLRI
jgi:Flp pilus assembly protein protease CpaA